MLEITSPCVVAATVRSMFGQRMTLHVIIIIGVHNFINLRSFAVLVWNGINTLLYYPHPPQITI